MRISDWSSDVCSSDLVKESVKPINVLLVADADMLDDRFWARTQQMFGQNVFVPIAANADFLVNARSEEHTSELQSLMRISYAVFCLKKKKQKNKHIKKKKTQQIKNHTIQDQDRKI